MTNYAQISTVAAVAQLQASFAAQQAGIAQAAAQSILTTPVAWTPTDASGASITFTSASGQWYIVGNLVVVEFSITYPGVTGATIPAILGNLPISVPNNSFAINSALCVVSNMSSATAVLLVTVPNSTTASLYNPVTQANITNNLLVGATLKCVLTYSAV